MKSVYEFLTSSGDEWKQVLEIFLCSMILVAGLAGFVFCHSPSGQEHILAATIIGPISFAALICGALGIVS